METTGGPRLCTVGQHVAVSLCGRCPSSVRAAPPESKEVASRAGEHSLSPGRGISLTLQGHRGNEAQMSSQSNRKGPQIHQGDTGLIEKVGARGADKTERPGHPVCGIVYLAHVCLWQWAGELTESVRLQPSPLCLTSCQQDPQSPSTPFASVSASQEFSGGGSLFGHHLLSLGKHRALSRWRPVGWEVPAGPGGPGRPWRSDIGFFSVELERNWKSV